MTMLPTISPRSARSSGDPGVKKLRVRSIRQALHATLCIFIHHAMHRTCICLGTRNQA